VKLGVSVLVSAQAEIKTATRNFSATEIPSAADPRPIRGRSADNPQTTRGQSADNPLLIRGPAACPLLVRHPSAVCLQVSSVQQY
jgi:hypothetical protein